MLTKERLQDMIHEKLGDSPLIIVSNREPYVHRHTKNGTTHVRIPGGLVSALDPVLQACHGIWIAHGSGDADRVVVDQHNEVRVPPDDPSYTLHRVWMNKEEENGFYYGYSNDALWPLCHIVYTRPQFRQSDWEDYKTINRRFADAIIETIRRRGLKRPFVFIQDYHLTLVAQYLKESIPDVVTAHFWHIPWPNAEVFRICPQKREILEGLLANDILGFHIQYHCNNFFDTVASELEARIDRGDSSVIYNGSTTLVKSFPISIDFEFTEALAGSSGAAETIDRISDEIGFDYEFLAVGVDRIDYTKGIMERLRAIDRFLEKYPEYQGRFVYLSYGALSRMHLATYKNLNDEITRYIEDLNWKYRRDNWQPVIFKRTNPDHRTLLAYYRAANLCLVSSMHDGMNLVAKEFVASQIENNGMLVLSQFTGAARELTDAVLINPFDTEAFADAIKEAIEMPREERVRRMDKMKAEIRENNIYTWVASIIQSLTKL